MHLLWSLIFVQPVMGIVQSPAPPIEVQVRGGAQGCEARRILGHGLKVFAQLRRQLQRSFPRLHLRAVVEPIAEKVHSSPKTPSATASLSAVMPTSVLTV